MTLIRSDSRVGEVSSLRSQHIKVQWKFLFGCMSANWMHFTKNPPPINFFYDYVGPLTAVLGYMWPAVQTPLLYNFQPMVDWCSPICITITTQLFPNLSNAAMIAQAAIMQSFEALINLNRKWFAPLGACRYNILRSHELKDLPPSNRTSFYPAYVILFVGPSRSLALNLFFRAPGSSEHASTCGPLLPAPKHASCRS